jgi:hypothetical protein
VAGVNWPRLLAALEREQGPEDEFDDEANGDPDSMLGEDDEEGFDELPVENGWPDDDEEGEDDEEDE